MNQKQYLAIDIGGTSVKLGVVDETGAVLAKAEESVSFDGYETPILTTVLKAAKTFVDGQGLSPASFVGVGVSATGQIDSRVSGPAAMCLITSAPPSRPNWKPSSVCPSLLPTMPTACASARSGWAERRVTPTSSA